MNLFKKILPYYKDFMLQNLFFYVIFLSPLGCFEWQYTIMDKPKIFEIIYACKSSQLPFFIAFVFYFTVFYFGAILYTFIPIIINIYLLRVNKFRFGNEDYKAMKILLLVSMNSFYLLSWMVIYTELIYRDFLMPLVFNLLGYILYVYFTKKPELNEV